MQSLKELYKIKNRYKDFYILYLFFYYFISCFH